MSNGGQLKSIELKFILHSYFRELQNNDLKEWHGDPTRDMPLLEVLKINGNDGWLPNQQLLNMPKLKEFLGVTWNTYCSACNLIRFPKMKHCLVMTRWKITRNIAEMAWAVKKGKGTWIVKWLSKSSFKEFPKEVNYGVPAEFVKQGFSPQCFCNYNSDCYRDFVFLPK